ncbi:Oidioi.mRNA.OKI2018_I69.XSR.g16499.t1.cds [Oikopleura dioica]|uniref:Oidioi.mRNA.OKI2018_I69.XSR.g16499.t1.cds n=1 Tax=Oikopleura dioica TaxID=34765 RepID=A0ABN7SLE2_OIKDI|nr:Oidioi.mRNA.OKI2018_I69.XSR.g16499.t1.cds [Oikopleura dioica]
MVLKRSVFLEVRRTQGRFGQKSSSFLEEYEEKQRKQKKVDFSKYGSETRSERKPAKEIDIDEIIRQTEEDFPDSNCFNPLPEKSERLEKESRLFFEMIKILKHQDKFGPKCKTPTIKANVDMLRSCASYMQEDEALPCWIKNAMTLISGDSNFYYDFSFAKEEMYGNSDIRRKTVMLDGFININNPIDENEASRTSTLADLGNRLETGKRGSMTKEQMMKLNTRRKSMILMVNQDKMNASDHRRDSLQAAGAAPPRGRRFAVLAKKASMMSTAFK